MKGKKVMALVQLKAEDSPVRVRAGQRGVIIAVDTTGQDGYMGPPCVWADFDPHLDTNAKYKRVVQLCLEDKGAFWVIAQ